MRYTEETAIQIDYERGLVLKELRALTTDLVRQASTLLRSAEADAYLLQGVCRRLTIIRRCMVNIFAIFPVDRNERLDEDERLDVEINLQAFIIHCHGVPDNLARIYLSERGIILNPWQIGLFIEDTLEQMPEEIRRHVRSERIRNWHQKYAKSYRDALAHRIPPYVPPAVYTPEHQSRYEELQVKIEEALKVGSVDLVHELVEEQQAIGNVCGAFTHSFLENDCTHPIMLHSQLLADARTVMEMINVVRQYLPAGESLNH